jgi:hypothetical protein
MKKNKYPNGWDEKRIDAVIKHYEEQTENDALVEDEAAYEDSTQTFIEVPKDLVPEVRQLIAKHAV